MKVFSTFLSAFAVIAGNHVVAAVRNCTSADLAGAYNSFRLTGDLSTYAPGTNQVVSYDHPVDSPITGVEDIGIVSFINATTACDDGDTSGDDILSPIVIAGIPASFAGDTSDKGGSIELRLPVELPAGDYTFLLTLTTNTDSCHFHSNNFTSNGQQVVDSCSVGESRCLDTSNFVGCVLDTDSTTNGTFTGTIQSCDAGTSCTQSGSTALCTSGSTGPVTNPAAGSGCVIPGSMRCVNETAWEQCVGAGDQWTWSVDPQLCAGGTTCGVYQTDYIICQ